MENKRNYELEGMDGFLANNIQQAQEHFETIGGYEQEALVDTVLKGLGFTPRGQ